MPLVVFSLHTFLLESKEVNDNQDYSNQDETICQVEYRPTIDMEAREIEKRYFQGRKVDVEKIKIQEIHYFPEAHAVNQISDRSAQDQT